MCVAIFQKIARLTFNLQSNFNIDSGLLKYVGYLGCDFDEIYLNQKCTVPLQKLELGSNKVGSNGFSRPST